MVRIGTIVARNYLAQAQVFCASAAEAHPEIEFTTLLVDGTEADRAIPGLGRVILLSDLGIDVAVLEVKKTIYDVMEFSVSLKPTLLAFLLAEGAEVAAYFDPDIFIYSRMDDLFEHTVASGISITPHAVTPFPTDDRLVTERLLMWAGIYNAGFMAVSAAGSPVVDWWEDRLKTHGIADPQNALYADQRWVDWVPALADPHIERGLGFNVAHWNLHERPITIGETGPLAGGERLRFLHFSGYDPAKPWLLSTHTAVNPRVLLSENPQLRTLCDEYGALLVRAGHPELRKSPYGFKGLANGFQLTLEIRRFVRLVLVGEIVGATLPPSAFEQPDEFEMWLHLPQFGSRAEPLSALQLAFWHGRPDLASVFPDPLGTDAGTYRRWFDDDPTAAAWRRGLSSPAFCAAAEGPAGGRAAPLPLPLPARTWAVVSSSAEQSGHRVPARALVDALRESGRDAVLLDESRYSTGDALSESPYPDLEASEDVTVVSVFTADALAPGGVRSVDSASRIAFVTTSPAQITPAVLQQLAAYDQVWASSAWTATWLHGLRRFPVRRAVLPAGPRIESVPAAATSRFRVAVNAINPGWRTSLDDAVAAFLAAFPSSADTVLEIEDIGMTVEAREQIAVLSATRPDIVTIAGGTPFSAGTVLLVLEPTQGIEASTCDAILAGVAVIAADHPGCTEYLAGGDPLELVGLRAGADDSVHSSSDWPGCDLAALTTALRTSLTDSVHIDERAGRVAHALGERAFVIGSPTERNILDPRPALVLVGTADSDASITAAVGEIRRRRDVRFTTVGPTRSEQHPAAASAPPIFSSGASSSEVELDDRLSRVISAAEGASHALDLDDPAWDLIDELAGAQALLVVGSATSAAPSLNSIYEWAALGAIAAAQQKPVVLSGSFIDPGISDRLSRLLGGLLRSARLVGVPDVESAQAAANLGAPLNRLYRVADDQTAQWWDAVATAVISASYPATSSPSSKLISASAQTTPLPNR